MDFTRSLDTDQLDITHHPQEGRIEATLENQTAKMFYHIRGDKMIMGGTRVPGSLAGMGIPHEMAHEALEFARQENLKVKVEDPFVKSFVSHHPEYHDIITALN